MDSTWQEEDFVWGAPAIAKTIGLSVRATYHMLEKGTLPATTKFGGRWCLIRPLFFAEMRQRAAERMREEDRQHEAVTS
jgi:hypothetical protein